MMNSGEEMDNNGANLSAFNQDGKPLQLVRFEQRDDFQESIQVTLDTNVLDTVLKTCESRKLCVVTVTGDAQSGKGLLLNVIKEALIATEKGTKLATNWLPNTNIYGFHCNHGYKPNTRGVWIWNRPFLIKGEDEDDENLAVLLLEAQGFHEDFTKPDEMLAIMGISMLTSSILVLNFSGDFPTVAFDWLETFCEFGVKLVEKGVEEPFQNLSFLIRDWTRLSEHSYGKSKKMLEKIIRTSGNVGGNLEKCFEKVDCFLMPHIGRQALLQTFEGNPADMSTDFSKRLQIYVKDLCKPENLEFKKILGNSLTAGEWKQFLTAYVSFFNDKSKMEWGLQAESIWWLTKEMTGKLKIDQALIAYTQTFQQRLENCLGGYIRERSIGGVHSTGKRKALEAFAEIIMPKEDEVHFRAKLEQLLEDEKEKIKRVNKDLRTGKITDLIRNALNKMRSELEIVFPFKSEDRTSVPSEFIFYENAFFHETLDRTIGTIEQEFIENFPDEEVEEISKAKETLKSVLQPIVEKYSAQNLQNRTRTVDKTQQATDTLMIDYKSEMNDFLDKLPKSDAEALRFYHDKQVKTLESKFKQLKIGTVPFQQQWLANLLENLEGEYETMESNLDWTFKKALEMAKTEQDKYKETLREKAESILESADGDIKDYHRNACKLILSKFATVNPLRKNVLGEEKVLKKLEDLLEIVYVEIVEEGVVAKRNLEKKLKEAMNTAVELYKGDMERKVSEEGGFIYEDFEEISRAYIHIATDAYEEKIENILKGDAELFEKEMDKLEAELEKAAESDFKKNEKRREVEEQSVATLYNQYNEEFEAKITATTATKLRTREEFIQEFNQLQQQTLVKFENSFSSTNKKLRQKYNEKLAEKTKEIFSDMEEFFQIKMQKEVVGTMTALVEVKKLYFEEMEGHFRNKSGPNYFSEEDLTKLHEHVKKVSLEKASNMEPSLDQNQLERISLHLEKYFETYKNKNDLIWRSYEDKEPALGIDLGTTYCCLGVYHLGKIIILRNLIGENTTPSYVTIHSDDGSTTCGKPAKETCFENPEETIYDAKRIIGRRMDDEKLQEDMKYWPFTVVEENSAPRIEINGHKYYPEEISAHLLKHLKQEAEDTLGIPIKKAVITVPAYFTDGQRQATQRAGEMAGLTVLGLLNEPSAAALAYKMEWFYSEEPRNILVFDLGGGTFDVVLLQMKEDAVEVLSIGGDDHLGGEDFDKNMMKYCADKFEVNTGIDLFDNRDSPVKNLRDEARRRLRRLQTSCEAGKKQLTTARSKTVISMAKFVDDLDLIVEVKMEEFEKLNATYFQKTLEIVDSTLRSAGLGKEDVDEIVLVGGSTRIPKVQQMLTHHFNGKALNKKINPDEAVAYGAAVQAAMLNAKPGTKVFDFATIQEVTPMSLGIEMATKELDVIIPKNAKIPTERTCTYKTHTDNQRTALIKIYQGELLEFAAANKLLGEFSLSGIPPNKATKEEVVVTMSINLNGILSVEAMCKSTGGKKSITVSENRGGMTEVEKQLLILQMAS